MKPLLIAIVMITFLAGLVIAQSITGDGRVRWGRPLSYDPKTPPPITLPGAYALAITKLGEFPGATNRFHCISASCNELSSTNGWTGWTFWFSNTNGDRASMWVFFDGATSCDVRSGEVFAK